ncbi:MAG: MobA-like NTP transferase domain protein [Lentisphaerae bacterium ADurb.BinA184]|nr:MAG: MobA-like NTP transferase domain protein [Lentisphaerae bacterium ADurb.BinA184]
MSSPTLVILAAGIGSRYGGFKQIDPVGAHGEIVLDYSLYDAWRAGFSRAVFVTRPELEAPLREHVAAGLEGRLTCDFVCQRLDDMPAGFAAPAARRKPWGTGHATWAARHAVHGPFAVINADDFYGPLSYRRLAEALAKPAAAGVPEYALVGFTLRNTLSEHGTVARGICTADADGYLVEVVERTAIEPAGDGQARCPSADGTGWIALSGEATASMNMWAFEPRLFDDLAGRFAEFLRAHADGERTEFYLPTAVDALLKAGRCRVRVLSTPEPWFGVTYPQDKAGVQAGIRRMVASGAYPDRLW